MGLEKNCTMANVLLDIFFYSSYESVTHLAGVTVKWSIVTVSLLFRTFILKAKCNSKGRLKKHAHSLAICSKSIYFVPYAHSFRHKGHYSLS